jgi:hypothetical protein
MLAEKMGIKEVDLHDETIEYLGEEAAKKAD